MTESTAPFKGNQDPQSYALTSSLTYQWDVATLEWVKGTQPGSGGGGAVTIADGADVSQGAKADAAWVAGDGTVIALLKTIAAGGAGLTDAQLRATPVPVSGTVTTKTDLAPSSPTAASVGVASAQAVAANASRKGLVLVNTSDARVSLGFGAAAVLDSGVTLYPGGVFCMDEYSFDVGAVNAIASAAASNLAVQEYA